jgi:hypothetical protein
MKLLERRVGHQFVGGVGIDFTPEGLRCEMRLPIAQT